MKNLIFILLLFPSISITAQNYDKISNEIDSIISVLDPPNALEFVTELKEFIDINYYSLVFKTLPDKKDTLERWIMLNHMKSIPVSSFSKDEYYHKACRLYSDATILFIRENSDDLDILNNLKIKLAFQPELYPILKMAIENAGGKWDRGELPEIHIYPPFKPIKFEKNEK